VEPSPARSIETFFEVVLGRYKPRHSCYPRRDGAKHVGTQQVGVNDVVFARGDGPDELRHQSQSPKTGHWDVVHLSSVTRYFLPEIVVAEVNNVLLEVFRRIG
jgi:hypothetical protein